MPGDCGVHCKSWRGDEPQSGVERAGGDTDNTYIPTHTIQPNTNMSVL